MKTKFIAEASNHRFNDDNKIWDIDDFPLVYSTNLSLHGPWGVAWVQSVDITLASDGNHVQTIYMGRTRA